MEVTLEMVRSVFVSVLEGRMTREDADRWAYSFIRESEYGSLTFMPPDKQDNIWSALMYLYGIDTLESPGKYLHNEEDIRMAMQEKVG